MQKVLIIDNYDSFTYNLVHYLESLQVEVSVIRNDELHQFDSSEFDKIVISPGPGLPQESGELLSYIHENYKNKSMLGICLGQQAIAQVFGAELLPLKEVRHGRMMQIKHLSNDPIYSNIPESFQVGLYHSWHVSRIPKEFIITAVDDSGLIMSFKHKKYDLTAVQYHPESIMTEYGKDILRNWLKK